MQIQTFLLRLLVFTNILCFAGCGITRESTIEIAEKAIRENPEFKETNDFCTQIPLPEGTNFVEKSRLFNSVGLVYKYYPEKPPEFLDDFFRKSFTKNGWKPIEPDSTRQAVDFKNEKFEVSVTLTGFSGDISFSIYCGKLDTKKK